MKTGHLRISAQTLQRHCRQLHQRSDLRPRGRTYAPSRKFCAREVWQQSQANGSSPGQPATEAFLDSIKWDSLGLVTVIAQDADSGEILMQAFSDRNGVQETLRTKLATFYSRSRQERWCKGETSGNYIRVTGVFLDCDKDSIVYLGQPDGPACHTGAQSCWFSEAEQREDGSIQEARDPQGRGHSPLPSLLALEQTIQQRREESAASPGSSRSWTAKLLGNQELLCSKVREEAGELCATLEDEESRERTASEMADLLYHSMVLLNAKGVKLKDVGRVLRERFGQSGIAEKASRASKEGQ